jgi:LysR family transcriptional regulator, glycine cleavage system transcriptional activator
MPPADDDLRLPSLDALRALDAAARLGSFERAADALAVTASAVGKRIAALEALIGTELFERGARGLQPTAAGRDYLAQVRPALTLLAAVPQHRRPAQRLRKLRISTPPTFARQVLVPALGEHAQAHPGVQLEVVLSIPFLDLRPGEADVEVLLAAPGDAGDPGHPGAVTLMHDVVLPLASPALLAGRPAVAGAADLARLPLLRTPLEPWRPWFRAAGLDGPEPAEGPMLVDLGLTLEAAVAGQGVALGRPTLALPWLASGALVPVLDLRATPAQHYVARHGEGDAARAFAAWLQARCRRLAEQALAVLDRTR